MTLTSGGGWQVVVGTPGRVHDMINRRALRTDSMKIFVLDEVLLLSPHNLFDGQTTGSSSSPLLPSSLELSDTHVYEP